MKNKKTIIYNILFIALILFNVMCGNVLATENVVSNEVAYQVIELPCTNLAHSVIVIVQVVLSFIAYILWGIAIYKLIKKDKKKAIILAIVGFVLFLITGFLGNFRCA